MGAENSRHNFAKRYVFTESKIFREPRRRINFVERTDSRLYTIKQGDSLFNLAHRFYRSFDRPAGLWWVLMDFNNIADPTQNLTPGDTIVIPSDDFIREQVFVPPRDFIEGVLDLPT